MAHTYDVVNLTKVVYVPGTILLERTDPPSQQMTTADCSTVRHKIASPTPLFTRSLGLGWICVGFVHAVTTTVNSYVQLPCWV